MAERSPSTAIPDYMLLLRLDADILLRPFSEEDVARLYAILADNRSRLDQWLRWSSALQSEQDVRRFILLFQDKLATGDGFHLGIWAGDRLAGGVVCWYLHPQHHNTELGYWLGQAYLRRGLATRAVASVIDHLIADREVHRVEMQCAIDNHRSRAVPQRLGFHLEGIRRQSHWISTRFVDHAVYGLLAPEWRAGRNEAPEAVPLPPPPGSAPRR